MALSNLTKVQTVGIGSNIEVVGVVTTGQFKSGTSNLHSSGVELTNLNVSGIATIGGNISIGGTLTYQDVTNVDSIGIITARAGVNVSGGQLDVGSNIKLGNAGVITATSFSGSGANLTSIPAGQLTGTVADARISTLTSSKLSGALPSISGANLTSLPAANLTGTLPAISGANLTSLPAANLTGTLPAISGANLTSLPAQATVNNNADNRVITGGSGVNLYAESGFTYDGTIVQIPDRINLNTAGTYIKSNQIAFNPTGTAYLDHYRTGQDIQIRMSTSSSLDTTGPTFKSNGNLAFASGKGIDFSAHSNTGSMTSELLDDYEEGSWLPSFYPQSSAMTHSYNLRTGTYVKIGRVVYWAFRMRLSGLSGQMGQTMGFAGLPYTVDNGQPQFTANLYGESYNGETATGMFYDGGTTRGTLYYHKNDVQNRLYASDLNPTNSYTAGTGFYFAA